MIPKGRPYVGMIPDRRHSGDVAGEETGEGSVGWGARSGRCGIGVWMMLGFSAGSEEGGDEDRVTGHIERV